MRSGISWRLRSLLLRVVGSDVGDVLVGQSSCNAAHGRILALALLVRIQCVFDVLGGLATQHGHLEHLGEGSLVAWDTVAADTAFNLVCCRLRIARCVRGC